MKGLLIKDLMGLRTLWKSYTILAGVYCVVSFMQKDTAMLRTLLYVLAMILVINSFSSDSAYKWDHYVLSTPVGRRQMVYSKYLLSLIVLLGSVLLTMMLQFVITAEQALSAETLGATLGGCSAMILMIDLMIPLIFKFGVEKSRIMLVLVFMVPFALLLLLGEPIKQLNIDMTWLENLPWLLPMTAIVLTWLSSRISLAIMQAKEF